MKEKKIRRNQNKGVRMERKGGKMWERKNEGPSPRVGVGGKKMKKNKEGKWGSTVENGSGWCQEKSKEMGRLSTMGIEGGGESQKRMRGKIGPAHLGNWRKRNKKKKIKKGWSAHGEPLDVGAR